MFQLLLQSEDLIPMFVCKVRFPSHLVPSGLDKRALCSVLSLADTRRDPRDGGSCFCSLVLSCISRASSGGVHLGYFQGVVDAVRASMLDASLNSLYPNF